MTTLSDRFHDGYEAVPNSGCWLWLGAPNDRGYGQLIFNHKRYRAHVLSWMLYNQSNVPSGMEICHKCDVKLCVNPMHLFAASHADNMLDARKKDLFRHFHGETNHQAKLSADDVREIRKRRANGETLSLLSRAFGVSQSMLSAICHRKNWKHI